MRWAVECSFRGQGDSEQGRWAQKGGVARVKVELSLGEGRRVRQEVGWEGKSVGGGGRCVPQSVCPELSPLAHLRQA